MAIGTETEGSLICPATRQGLWTIKPKLGTVSNAGIMPISIYFDVAGPMCKTVEDTVNLLDALRSPETESSLLKAVKGAEGWKDLRIGALAPEAFRFDDGMQVPVPEAREQMVSLSILCHRGFLTQSDRTRLPFEHINACRPLPQPITPTSSCPLFRTLRSRAATPFPH